MSSNWIRRYDLGIFKNDNDNHTLGELHDINGNSHRILSYGIFNISFPCELIKNDEKSIFNSPKKISFVNKWELYNLNVGTLHRNKSASNDLFHFGLFVFSSFLYES